MEALFTNEFGMRKSIERSGVVVSVMAVQNLPKKAISERPAEVERRNQCGDFEGDMIVGKNHKDAIVAR